MMRGVTDHPAMGRTMAGCMVFTTRSRALARETGARAGQRDQAGQDRAKQRKKDDRLIHSAYAPGPVMPALVAGIQAFATKRKTWMAGTSPAMTTFICAECNIASALHQIDIFDGDRPAVAVKDNKDCKTDRRFGSSHREHQ
jgi:hypothetical protein